MGYQTFIHDPLQGKEIIAPETKSVDITPSVSGIFTTQTPELVSELKEKRPWIDTVEREAPKDRTVAVFGSWPEMPWRKKPDVQGNG